MDNKLILIVLDGLNSKTAYANMGFLESLVNNNICSAYTVKSELPAMSRPLYETIHTGLPVYKHGILNNECQNKSNFENIFSIVKKAGGLTAACAYLWVSELYNKTPFNFKTDRFFTDGKSNITLGSFYWEDNYPDSHLFADANYFISNYSPDYLLLHSMNIDDLGHKFGGDSKEYGYGALKADIEISKYLFEWQPLGYNILITADHGMNQNHYHNGPADEEALVPLYIFSNKYKLGDYRNKVVSQLEIAPICLEILNLPKSSAMINITIERNF